MKQRLKLNKYFLDPSNDSCDELINQIKVLDGSIKKLGKANQARIPGVVSEKYENYLKKSSIPEKNQNPEKVMKDISQLFKGAVRWHHPGTMINITPPPLIPAIAATTMTMLFNPNLAIDISCGGLSVTELEVVKHMATLVNWDWRKAFGVFTFGGKGTNLYAVKAALNKCYPDFKEKGVHGKIAITSTEQGHPCHIEVCDWLGLGRSSCLRLPLDASGRIDVVKAEKIMSAFIKDGGEIPCMIVNGGTTLHNTINGKQESFKVWENPDFILLLVPKSINSGHVILIPKIHVDYIFDLKELLYSRIFIMAKKISLTLKKITKFKRIGLAIEGFGVRHVHIHLVPVNEGNELNPLRAKKIPTDKLQQMQIKFSKEFKKLK